MSKNKKELKANSAILRKPSQTIAITIANSTDPAIAKITAVQRKAYNILLCKAQQDLIFDNSLTKFVIGIAEIKDRAGIKDTNNKRLKDDLRALTKIDIETIHDNGDWDIFNLLGRVGKQGDLIEFEFSSPIRDALIANDYYTTLDLMIIKSLECKYAIIFYELAIRYEKVEIPKLDINEFRMLTGTESEAYNDFANLRIKCIKPGINEVNAKTDIELSYEIFKIGRKVTAIKFHMIKKPQVVFEAPKDKKSEKNEKKSEVEQSQSNQKSDQKNEILQMLLAINVKKKTAIEIVKSNDEEYIRDVLKYVDEQNKIKKKDNPAGFFIDLVRDQYDAYGKRSAKLKAEQDKIIQEQRAKEVERQRKIDELKDKFRSENAEEIWFYWNTYDEEKQKKLIEDFQRYLRKTTNDYNVKRFEKIKDDKEKWFNAANIKKSFEDFMTVLYLTEDERSFEKWLKKNEISIE